MEKNDKKLIGVMSLLTLVFPPYALVMWIKLYDEQSKHIDNLNNIIIKGFGGITEALKPLAPKDHKEDA